MTSPFIPYGRQTVTDGDVEAVEAVLRSPFLTQGPAVPAFEEAIARKVSAKNAVAVNSATSALHIACMGLGLKKGGLLWTSPITFVASANCGRYCDADVDFVDIDSNTGQMCHNRLNEKLKEAEKRQRLPNIIVPVHLAGTSCSMREIKKAADKYGISIIEDASHAIGGKYRGRPVGCCEYSDATVFSFHPVKIITCAEGGIACCNDEELTKKMRFLRSHGITKDPQEFYEEAAGPWSYEQQMLGYNYRMTDIQAALGLSQLNRLENIVEKRNKILDKYKEDLSGLPIEFLEIPTDCYSALHLAVIRLKDKTAVQHRRVFEGMRKDGIGVQLHYTPVHLQPYYRNRGFKEGDFPEAENYGRSAISIPMYPGLEKNEIERVASSLRKYL